MESITIAVVASGIGSATAVGLDLCELPDVAMTQRDTGQDLVLQPSMTFAIEPLFASEYGLWILEHNLAINEDGYTDVYSRPSANLVVIT